MSDAGHCRIYRCLIGHPAFRNDGEAMAFAWMVMKASWRPVRVRYKGHGISLQRGDLAVSIRDMAVAMDRPKGWVERLFARLQNEAMIKTRNETGVSVITVCNYDKYQLYQTPERTPDGTVGETPTGQTQDTEQGRERKKEESSKELSKPKTKNVARVFPPDWSLSESDRTYAISKGLSPQEIERAVEDFRGYFLAAGTNKRSTDWSLNWQGWCRRATDYRKPGGAGVAGRQSAGRGRSGARDIAELVAERHAEEDARMAVPRREAGLFGDDDDWSRGAIEGEYRPGDAAGRGGDDAGYAANGGNHDRPTHSGNGSARRDWSHE